MKETFMFLTTQAPQDGKIPLVLALPDRSIKIYVLRHSQGLLSYNTSLSEMLRFSLARHFFMKRSIYQQEALIVTLKLLTR
jgi:hypothetical protein